MSDTSSPRSPDGDGDASLSSAKAKLIEARLLSEQTSSSLPPPESDETTSAIKVAYDLGMAAGREGANHAHDDVQNVLAEMDAATSGLSDWRAKQAADVEALTAQYAEAAEPSSPSSPSRFTPYIAPDSLDENTAPQTNDKILSLIESGKNKPPEAPATNAPKLESGESRLAALRVQLQTSEMLGDATSAAATPSNLDAANADRMRQLELELAAMDNEILSAAPMTPREDIDALLKKMDALDAVESSLGGSSRGGSSRGGGDEKEEEEGVATAANPNQPV